MNPMKSIPEAMVIASSVDPRPATSMGGDKNDSQKIFDVVLNDWMFGYNSLYQLEDYHLLHEAIRALMKKQLPLKFFLPAFPCKSTNKKHKVFGEKSDFAEFLAIRNILTTLRKLETEYDHGVEFIIMSDYHTFDQYIGVTEEEYKMYHKSLQKHIDELGAEDVIKIISLASYEEFKNTPPSKISEQLFERFGDKDFLEGFDKKLETREEFMQTYTQMKRFMQKDQTFKLPGKPGSKATKNFVKKIARGMMNQGVALDRFLKSYNSDIVRLSIHNHHPQKGKFAMDLFKVEGSMPTLNTLRTPWHNVVCFDAREGQFIVENREKIESGEHDNSSLLKVNYNDDTWMYMLVKKTPEAQALALCLEVSMVRGGFGMLIRSKDPEMDINCIEPSSITSLIKQFGVIVFEGFKRVIPEDEMLTVCEQRTPTCTIKWNSGYIHKIKQDENVLGAVSTNHPIPINFNLIQPPFYIAMDQEQYAYQDVIPRKVPSLRRLHSEYAYQDVIPRKVPSLRRLTSRGA